MRGRQVGLQRQTEDAQHDINTQNCIKGEILNRRKQHKSSKSVPNFRHDENPQMLWASHVLPVVPWLLRLPDTRLLL